MRLDRQSSKVLDASLGQMSQSVAAGNNQSISGAELLYEVDNYEVSNVIEACIYELDKSDIPVPEKFLLKCLLMNGLRVSEIANPFYIRLLDNNTMIVYSFKQKCFKKYPAPEIPKPYNYADFENVIRGWDRSRQHYYRVLQHLIGVVESGRKKNTAITHAARNAKAQKVYEETLELKEVMKALAIKSEKAALSYLTHNQYKEYFNTLLYI